MASVVSAQVIFGRAKNSYRTVIQCSHANSYNLLSAASVFSDACNLLYAPMVSISKLDPQSFGEEYSFEGYNPLMCLACFTGI